MAGAVAVEVRADGSGALFDLQRTISRVDRGAGRGRIVIGRRVAARRWIVGAGHGDIEPIGAPADDHDVLPAWIEAETEVRRPPRDGHEAQVRAPARIGREAGDGRVVRARAAEDDGQGLRATESLGVHDHPRAALRHPRVQLTRGRRAVAVGEAPVELERASGLRGERRTQNDRQRREGSAKMTESRRDHFAGAPRGRHVRLLGSPPSSRVSDASETPARSGPVACPESSAGRPAIGRFSSRQTGKGSGKPDVRCGTSRMRAGPQMGGLPPARAAISVRGAGRASGRSSRGSRR